MSEKDELSKINAEIISRTDEINKIFIPYFKKLKSLSPKYIESPRIHIDEDGEYSLGIVLDIESIPED